MRNLVSNERFSKDTLTVANVMSKLNEEFLLFKKMCFMEFQIWGCLKNYSFIALKTIHYNAYSI